MTFIDIYNRTIHFWGEEINFSDGSITESGSAKSGFVSNQLSKKWYEVEKNVGTDDAYADLMGWTMFQVFHKHAIQLFNKNIFTLKPTDISIIEIEQKYFNNLNEEGWEELLFNYKRILV
jgi:hypothetical protein